MAQEIEFKVLRFGDGTYHWHLETADHRVIAWSGQAYESKQACVTEVFWIRDHAAAIPAYDHTGEARLPRGGQSPAPRQPCPGPWKRLHDQ